MKLDEAVHILKNSGVIVFPTETAYGLGADATNERAVERLMAIKGREGWKTPPLIAADREMVEQYANLSPTMHRLADEYWPGPLTLVVPTPGVGQHRVLANGVVREGTIAVRVSSHKLVQELSRELGAPIVATSANVAGQPSCYDVASVRAQFATHLLQPDFYLDDGPLATQKPSTIVAEQDGELVVLRQGEIIV